MAMTKKLRILILILVIATGIFLLRDGLVRSDRADSENVDPRETSSPKSPSSTATKLDTSTSRLIYTKHARCRMGCRKISEEEVKEILEIGRINYGKSDPASRPDPKYALEGETADGQEVRIIFAPTDRGMVVITVIDLEREWSCDCK